ncbi:ParA family protein [Comamonas thiooxydans]|uniref:AAA domain-containing protein n=1 Tax=Comamonas thiooxydans TaxID=363952 RepID=A0A0E3BDQ1_9BURK|nr:ParA family protein [Comamonas thiooxydans]KGG83626.1 hypothetical protein P245_25255 [Comamonas thiooxydans]KGH22999.1 hypothetical protein P606_13275 [Comamonas thiooxydans]
MEVTLDELVNPDAVTLGGFTEISEHSKAALINGRQQMLHPNEHKQAPLVSMMEIAQVFDIDYDKLRKRYKYKSRSDENQLSGWIRDSSGNLVSYDGKTKGRVYYQINEITRIVKAVFPECLRPDGIEGVVVTICNFKGGVTKSTSTMTYAQVLTLRGLRVCVIDLDPQGTTTKWLTTHYITAKESCHEIFAHQTGSLRDFVQPTYWPNIDFIPSHGVLQNVESHFHNLLKTNGPEAVQYFPSEVLKLRDDYDVILIDTPPSLNNLTLSAMFSSDGLVMPLVPSNPDIESASEFWKLYIDTCKVMGVQPSDQLFEFVRILISKSENTTTSNQNMVQWIKMSYPGRVMPTEIPKSAAVARAADAFGTVFDEPKELARGAKLSREQMKGIYSKATADLSQLIYGIWDRKVKRQLYLQQQGLAS